MPPHHTSEALGLRERKKQATARALELAALQLVDEHGLDAVTVDEIAATAGVSPRTFFNYFSSKEAALVGGMPDDARRFAAALLERPIGERPLDAARAVFAANASEFESHADMYRLRMRVISRNPELYPRMIGAFGEWEHTIAEAIAQRTDMYSATDIYPLLMAAVIGGVIRTSMRRWSASDFRGPLGAIFDEAFELVASGLGGAS